MSTASKWMQDAMKLAESVIEAGEGDLTEMGEFPDVEFKVSLISPALRGHELELTWDCRSMRYIKLHIWLFNTINKLHDSWMGYSLHSVPTSVYGNDTVPIPNLPHHVIQTIHLISPLSSNPPHPPHRSKHNHRAIRYICSGHWLVPKRPKRPTKRWQLPPRHRRLISLSRLVLPQEGSGWGLHLRQDVLWDQGRHQDGRARHQDRRNSDQPRQSSHAVYKSIM